MNKAFLASALLLSSFAFSAVFADTLGDDWGTAAIEQDYYTITTIPLPEEVKIEAGSFDLLPDGRLAVGTRRGQIWLVSGAFKEVPTPTYHLYADGLDQVFGLSWSPDEKAFYITQQTDVSRISDQNGDGRADLFETLSDEWDFAAYHEFSFGSKRDKEGNIWVALGLTASYRSENRFRGWGMKVTPDGKTIPVCSGMRSPGGVGENAEGVMFYVESQGPWNSCCSLKQMKQGAFVGHPASYVWYPDAPNMGPTPVEPNTNSRMGIERKRIKQLVPPAVMFPYIKMGRSISGFSVDRSGGKFGPFEGQMFVGDYSLGVVMRATTEKINGVWQGACYPFREGFSTGLLANQFSPEGQLVVGGTSRGWPIRGTKSYSLERLDWTGKVPFEVKEINIRPEGYRITFTQPVEKDVAEDPSAYNVVTYTYPYHQVYGGPEVDHEDRVVTKAKVTNGGLSVDVDLDLRQDYIHEFELGAIRSKSGKELVHTKAYYTVNEIPSE
jgi:hypothetical protein